MRYLKYIGMMANKLWNYHFPLLILFSLIVPPCFLYILFPLYPRVQSSKTGIRMTLANQLSLFLEDWGCHIFDFELTSCNEFCQRTGTKNCVLFLAHILSMPFNDFCGTGSTHAVFLSILSISKHKQALLYNNLKLTR